MARSHHRPKKHHPQQPHHTSTAKTRSKATSVFLILFSVFGAGIGYFAGESILALIIGLVVGSTLGYLIGRSLDKQPVKK